MKVVKNNHSFNVCGDFSTNWFSENKLEYWEQDTFHILDYYKNHTYIDIGSWIGPTVLYSANIFKRVIAIEPDPIAIKRIEANINANDFKNITLVKKGLSDKNGTTKFGGNGEFGNSESTLLIARDDYLTYEGRHTTTYKDYHPTTEVETITIETLFEEQNVNPSDVGLIKMDIEGGELIVVPYLVNFLKNFKPVFYISLHYCYLKMSDIKLIVDILFDIYEYCFHFECSGKKVLVTKKQVINYKISTLVFE